MSAPVFPVPPRVLVGVAIALLASGCMTDVGAVLDAPVDAGSDRTPPRWPDAATPVAIDAAPEPDPEPQRDCREDYPEIPWTFEHTSECSKCYDCPSEGLLPGVAFITCKIDDTCYRFATVDNCNYDLCPRGSCTLPVHDPNAYCRKDGINYTYFVCRLKGVKRPFQTVNATNYFQKKDVEGNTVYDVADALPIVGGCLD